MIINEKFNKIWLLSDLHFGIYHNDKDWLKIQKDYFFDFFIPMIERTKDQRQMLLVLGDVFDNRRLLDIDIISTVYDIFKKLGEILPVFIIVGNHDTYKKGDNDINSLTIFKEIKNVNVYSKPDILTVNNKNLLLCPWITDKEEEKEVFKKYIKNYKCEYVFAHTEFNGMSLNSDNSISNSGLDISDFKNVKIISGHIHSSSSKETVLYTGSPYSMTRIDINTDKKLFYIETETDNWVIKETINNFSPKFLKLNFNDIMEMDSEEFIKIIKNNFVDIVIDNSKIDIFLTAMKFFPDVFKDARKVSIKNEDINGRSDISLIVDEETNQDNNITFLFNQYINKLPEKDKIPYILNEIDEIRKEIEEE